VVAATAAASKTDEDTVLIEVAEVLPLVQYFVITGGRNPRQVKTIAETVEERVRAAGGPSPVRTEGLDTLQWVLVDYGDVVVHVFHDDARRFYELERLWGDRPRIDWRSPAG
jgi:ribosome-associated protein